MSDFNTFVDEYFLLGVKEWVRKYGRRNYPAETTVDSFVKRIHETGSELRFIDKPDWTGDTSEDLPCYLVVDPKDSSYSIFTIDRGIAFKEASFEQLSDAIRFKAKLLLALMSIRSAGRASTQPPD